MFKEREERQIEKEGRQHGETKVTTSKPHGRKGGKTTTTTLYWNADTKQWQRQFIRKKPPTPQEQDDRLRIAANEQKRAKIEAQRDAGDIFPDLRGGGGDIPDPVLAQQALKRREEFEDESGAHEWGPGGQPTASDQIFSGTDGDIIDQEKQAALNKKQAGEQIALKNERYLKSVSWDGMNRTYTTNYREAVKNAAGWSQFYDETDDAGNPIKRSDVFTIDPDTGEPMGVLTRRQRRAKDLAIHEATTKATLTDDELGTVQDSNRSAVEAKAIHSKDGLETVIGGKPETAKINAQETTGNVVDKTSDILTNKDDIELP